MKHRTDPLETYAEKLLWVDVTQVPTVGARVNPNERDLFCGKCEAWTSHIFLGTGWLCYVTECGGYIPETSIESQKEFDKFADVFEFRLVLGE